KKTSAYSIRQNLLLDTSKTFVFYKKSHIGLREKEYSDTYLVVESKKDKKTWEESYNSLLLFIKNNDCLPSPKSQQVEEKTLYNWLNIQKSKFKNKKLNPSQSEQINFIITQFNLTSRK